jgi:hypothetical protein
MDADLDDEAQELLEFLRMPLSDTNPVFDKFAAIPGKVDRGVDPYRFIYVRGSRKDKILLVAHADTYWGKGYGRGECHEHEVHFEDGIFSSRTNGFGIGADDRSGCAILWLLREYGHSLLLTSGEEYGQRASHWLMGDPGNADIFEEINKQHGFVIQFDRRNGSDYKCYEVGTEEFRCYVEGKTGFREPDLRSKTDIKVLCRDVPGANLSIGYQYEHTESELLRLEDWKNTLEICKKWFAEDCLPVFKRG